MEAGAASNWTFASSELSLSLKAVIRLQFRQFEIGSPVRAGGRRSVDGFLTAS